MLSLYDSFLTLLYPCAVHKSQLQGPPLQHPLDCPQQKQGSLSLSRPSWQKKP